MKAYLTTRHPLDTPGQAIIRFHHDQYKDEDYVIFTLEDFTKVIELAKAWAEDTLETIFCEDVNALIDDFLSTNPNPSRLAILADEETMHRIGERVSKWGEEPEFNSSTDSTRIGSTISEETQAALEKYLEREYSKARKPRARQQNKEEKYEPNNNEEEGNATIIYPNDYEI